MGAGRTTREKNKLYLMPNIPAAALTAGIALQVCVSELNTELNKWQTSRKSDMQQFKYIRPTNRKNKLALFVAAY